MFYNSSVSEIETVLDMNKLWISLEKDPAFWKWIQVNLLIPMKNGCNI